MNLPQGSTWANQPGLGGLPVAPGAAPAAEGGAPAAEEVSVLWWRSQSGSIGDLLAKFVVDFNDANPGIVVQDEYQGDYIETMNKVIAAAAANALPDMLLVGDGQYLPLARNGILLNMNDLIDGPNGLDLTEYMEPINRGKLDGNMYQLAYGVSTPIFYYNKELLDAAGLSGAPDTWDIAFNEYFPKLATEDLVSFAYSPGNWWQQSAV